VRIEIVRLANIPIRLIALAYWN